MRIKVDRFISHDEDQIRYFVSRRSSLAYNCLLYQGMQGSRGTVGTVVTETLTSFRRVSHVRYRNRQRFR